MHGQHLTTIARELSITVHQAEATAALLDEGATIPFIARYRKERTGSLDEVAVAAIRDRLTRLRDLDKRREAIFKSLEERELLTDDLKTKLLAAETMAVLEDVYLPYRPKRRTRATVAREKGLEPLAQRLFSQENMDPTAEAGAFVDAEKGVESIEDALAGARDIIAEQVNEDQAARAGMRTLFATKGVIRSRVVSGKEEEGSKYRDYFDWEEAAANAPSHRILAMRRGENEGILTLSITPPEAEALAMLEQRFVTGDGAASEQVRMAVHDGYKRLLSVSMETEIRTAAKQRADAEAIAVFTENLRELLLASPLGQKQVMAIDPGFRTGCKVVCMDRQGALVHADTVYPHASKKQREAAGKTIRTLCEAHKIEAIAIGNGTAGRETEAFIRSLTLPGTPVVMLVNESGASVYSASEAARAEFPEQDVTVRGSVSIGRRLMDPLAELVKIDPKAIGVGQYQHDVDQGALKRSLDDVVVSCVNNVGVEVNTASPQLLTYVSGLGPQLARSIVAYREKHGAFPSKESLKEVPRLGPKAFEQAAGFLRIRQAENPLDGSAVHPESYPVVDSMAQELGCSVADLMRDEHLREKIDLNRYITGSVGLPTLTDIMAELAQPGRDPREQFDPVRFTEGVTAIEDVKPGMKLAGVITNVTAFGAFVDIGVHQDGLVHISQLADRYVKNASDVVKVGQKVTVSVLNVDLARQRISLSMRDAARDAAGVSGKAENGKQADGAPRQAHGKSADPKRRNGRNRHARRAASKKQKPDRGRAQPKKERSIEASLDVLVNRYKSKL